ncbi:MAG: hypothetical protein M1825_003390 [Sarcosagium campestre]|nr:MAG: hypothetical protein M1825_003390 [Sarcosagium campestre]
MGSAIKDWGRFLDRCLLARVPADDFETLARELQGVTSTPIRGSQLCEIFLRPRSRAAVSVDPLVPIYVDRLLNLSLVSITDVLRTLLKNSRFHHSSGASTTTENENGEPTKVYNPPDLEEIVLLRVRLAFTTGRWPQNSQDILGTLKAISRWMSSIVAAGTKDEMMQDINGGTNHQVAPESIAIRDAVGLMALALAENAKVMSVLSGSIPKDIRQTLAHSLSLYIPFLSQTSLQIANRLEAFQRQHHIFDGPSVKEMESLLDGVEVDALQMNGIDAINVADAPILNSRAGLYIFLNSLLVGRPMVEDTFTLNYLSSRYKGDLSTLTSDLIVASFDVLSNAMFRNENQDTLFLLRTFLVNKVPLLLTTLSRSMYPPLTPEYCITQALNHVNPEAFPSLSSMFDVSAGSGLFSDVRQEFLFACCLHGLIAEESIEPLLGEIPMQELPQGGKLTKEQLVGQCMNDPERVETLLGEIEGMDGNAGAVVGALLEVLHHLCSTNDTMSLKTVCTSLAKKPLSLDVMLLFSSPSSILGPICQLLDTWQYEEDQGEYQPVYEEFGGVMLLVLTFVHRYDLSTFDLGIASNDSFVARQLDKGDASIRIGDLNATQSSQLGGWIRGLVETDNGISDELMSSCRPQEFYTLTPTLFSQCILACHAKVLDLEALKGGLEYLLEPFLLPSLVNALTWLSHHVWESHGDIETILPILQTLLKPPSLSSEASGMHTAIMSIVAKPLEQSLRSLRRHDPSRSSDIDAVLPSLQSHASIRRAPTSHHSELESWTATHSGGLCAALRNTFQSLVLWASTPDINMTPASYTHRQLLVGVQVLGAKPVLRALTDELKLQTQNGSGDLALDIATALVCAPSAAHDLAPPASRRLSLRQALALAHDDIARIAAVDAPRAEAVVRLHRRVESQMAAPQPTDAAVVSANMMSNIHHANAAVVNDVAMAGIDVNHHPLAGTTTGDIDDVLDEAAAGLIMA